MGANEEGIAYKISFTCNKTAESRNKATVSDTFKCKWKNRMSKTKIRHL